MNGIESLQNAGVRQLDRLVETAHPDYLLLTTPNDRRYLNDLKCLCAST